MSIVLIEETVKVLIRRGQDAGIYQESRQDAGREVAALLETPSPMGVDNIIFEKGKRG